MAKAKNSARKARKISDISAPKAAPTGRPIIVSNPTVSDPMVNEPQAATDSAPALSTHGKTIEPPKHDEPATDNTAEQDTSVGVSPSEIIEKAKAQEAATAVEPQPAALEASTEEKPDIEVDNSEKEETEPETGPGDSGAANEPNADEEKNSAETNKVSADSDKAEAEARADQATAERQAKYEEMVRSEKYFVPIGAVQRRHDRYWLLVVVLILLAIIILDLLFDAGVIKIRGFNFYTNFIDH